MRFDKRFITNSLLAVTAICALPVHATVDHRQINSANSVTYVSNEAWQPDNFENGTIVPATYVPIGDIVLDGKDQEPAWQLSHEVEVTLLHGVTDKAFVKALYTDDEVFLRVRWADDSEDRQHHPWVWDPHQEKYIQGPQVEDGLMISFEAGCEWTPSLLGGYMYDFDAWHWLAARSDPLSQALDLYGNIQDRPVGYSNEYQSRVLEDDWVLKFIPTRDSVDMHAKWYELDRAYLLQPVTKTLFVRAIPDPGSYPPLPFVEPKPAPVEMPADISQLFPSFEPLPMSDDAGEVGAKGHWEDGFWTVEFRRILETPANYLTDAVFNRLTQFSVHVYNGTDRVDESSESKRLFLSFLPKETPNLAQD